MRGTKRGTVGPVPGWGGPQSKLAEWLKETCCKILGDEKGLVRDD
jgi:hypothetical protein